MTTIRLACDDCKHFNHKAQKDDPYSWGTCKAFPGAIPASIWGDGGRHRDWCRLQEVILLLVQGGGPGIITFSTIYLARPRGKMSLVRHRAIRGFYLESTGLGR